MSPVLPLALSLLLISVALTHAVFGGRWLNPVTALFVPHILLLISYQLALDGGLISLELSDDAWALLSAAYLCYAVGIVAACFASPAVLPAKKKKAFDLVEAGHFHGTTVFLVAILFVSVVSKYFKILTTYGNPVANIIQIRQDYVTDVLSFGLAGSVSLLSSFLIMMNLGIIIGLRKARARWLIPTAITLVMFNDFSIGGAYWTFLALCMLFIARYIAAQVSAAPAKVQKRKPSSLLSLAIIPLAMGLLLFLRTEGKIGTELSIYDIYVTYMGGNIASFGYFLDNPFPSVPAGRHVFGGAYGLLNGVLSLFDAGFLPANKSNDYVANIGIPWNTSIHLAYYFADFGWVGMLLSSMALGLIAGAVYMKVLRKPGLLGIQYCVVVLYMVVVSIRNVPTEGQYFWILLVVLPAMNAYNRRRHRQEKRRAKAPPARAAGAGTRLSPLPHAV